MDIQSFIRQTIPLGDRGDRNSVVIPNNYLHQQCGYATCDPIVSRLVTFYQELLFKMPVNIIASVARKGGEHETSLDLASKEFNASWVPILKQCVGDLLTYGFYILMFDNTNGENIYSYYSKYNAGISTDTTHTMSTEVLEKLMSLPDSNNDSVYRPGEVSIFGKKPVRIDPCSVQIRWTPDWIKGIHNFSVETPDKTTLNAIVFYDPSCFKFGMFPQSCVQRVIPYADSLEQIRNSQVKLYAQMPHPLLIVSNNFDNKNFMPPLPTNIASRQQDDVTMLDRTAATMVSNYSTSNELVSFSLEAAADRDMHRRPVPSRVKSNLINTNVEQNTMLNTNSVIGLPPNHTITQIEQPQPSSMKDSMDDLASNIAIQFGVYPTIFNGDIKNTTNEGLRMLYQQISGFVNNMQTLFKGHMTIMVEHCFPEIRVKMSKTAFEYNNSRIEVTFSSSESATAQDILDFWNLGVISNDAFVNKITGMFNVTEIDKNFKPNIVPNNDLRLLEKERMKADIALLKTSQQEASKNNNSDGNSSVKKSELEKKTDQTKKREGSQKKKTSQLKDEEIDSEKNKKKPKT